MAMMPKKRRIDDQMRFGLMWPNTKSQNVTSGTVAAANPNPLDVGVHQALARTVERVGFDYAFFADTYAANAPANIAAGHGEPRIYAPLWAPVVMLATEHLGVVTTLHTRYLPAAVIARIGSNLDAISNGRWAWNAVPGVKAGESALFGGDDVPDERRYDQARESIAAVKALWAAGVGEKVEFHGEFVDVAGTMAGPVPVQAMPPIFNPGVSPAGIETIAGHCDFGFTAVVDDVEIVRAQVENVAAAAEAAGREPGAVQVAGSISIVLGDTEEEAQERYQWFLDAVDVEAGAGFAKFFLANSATYAKLLEGLPWDEQIRRIGVGAGSSVLVGTSETVAEQLAGIQRETGLKNFLLTPFLWAPEEIARLEGVFSALAERGVWTPPSERGWSW
ncbi:LLM class flavin-dependent oxidoreductase [Microbacterium immunditiarum]|uniref:Alkanesulfonate monooxygenase SsuD/methylene tetrahydromethanopterin reductase-like flavin-dependent oxidoreductase (Luciferase family) n=1 Tax=Microbacterium immunditiarum TaxID=337480 RepID=A0A7Y9GTV8_9MICO|nr:LLM class flavin-dependent oxidoreductase [Microbacterium immunditiarum]NYE21545.1 alkanesulfonate monooxygenase SsuD/methylene tetrahydromethanopterin reductase-like flavin-dependent oxidoreductase (luciferase family) [Microbacterium immunditiarum]